MVLINNMFTYKMLNNNNKKLDSHYFIHKNKTHNFIFHFSCGLVAVVMAAQSFGINLTFDYIFNAAKDRGFTRQGEMFSGK